MKKFFTLLAFLTALSFAAKANPIGVEQARKIGAKYLQANTEARVASAQDLQLATTYLTESSAAAFYIFNGPSSFVIVAADDCATPILGMSSTHQFDLNNIPPALEWYLQGFVEQIQYGIESHLPAIDTVAHQWELVQARGLLIENRATTAEVQPLLTSKWGQGSNGYMYNMYCPEDPEGPNGHTITGCTATAMGQVMRYWKYPKRGSGSHSYTLPGYGTLYANFGNTTYDWDNMPDELYPTSTYAQNNAVATLLYHCGVAVEMDYGPGNSGAFFSVDALVNYFNYSSDLTKVLKEDYNNSQWFTLFQTCLDKGRPILYSGWNSVTGSGHSFVCDGYNANNQLHFNWGWYGDNDDYYAVGALTPGNHEYNSYNEAYINMYPGECEDNSLRTLPYSDSFEAGNTQWWCWDKIDYSNSSNGYRTSWSTLSYGSGDMCIKHYYHSTRNLNDWAIMPKMFLQPGRDNTKLTFQTYETAPQDYTFEGVYISTTGTSQDDFTLLWTQNNPSASWKNVTVNLNSYQGQSVYIAFVYKGEDGHNWFIDNVNVTESWASCPSTSLPFEDHFDSEIGSCWYIIDGDMSGEQKCWQWKESTQSAYHPYGQQNKPQVGWLISRALFLQPGRDATTLTFYSASTSSGTGQKNSVWIAIDKPLGALTPSDFTVKVWEDPDYSNSWTSYSVDLSDYQGHIINIGFKYEGTYAHNWFVDDVVVTERWQPCSSATAPYSISFDSGLGTCWYVIDSDQSGGERCWKYDQSSQSVYHPWGQEGKPQVGWLFSNKIWLPTNNSYRLSFKSKCVSSGEGRRSSVRIAVDKGDTPNPSDYTEIWVDPSYSGSWTTYEIDLSAYSGHYVSIAFKYEGTFAHSWYIDDFDISPIPTYTITASASPSAGGTVSGGGSYNHGTTCTLTATANSGYHFVNWTKNGSQVSTSSTYSFTVTSGGTYVANFALDSYTITASAIPAVGGTVSGGGSYNHGTTCTLTATANSGYNFVNWTKDGTQVSTSPTYSFTVTSAGSYVASFEAVSTSPHLTVYPDASENSNTIPMYVFYFDDYSRSQHIMPASELTALSGKQITAIKYYTTSANIPYTSLSEIDFYLKEVSQTTLSSFVDKSTAQIVYHGTVDFLTASSGGEVTINFTTPFSYNGGNLLVGCDNTTDAGYENIYFVGEIGHTNAAVYGSNAASLGNVAPTSTSFLPKTTFFYSDGGDITQATNISQGWNWWSTYIEASDLLEQLENGLGTHGQTIKSQNGYVQYMPDYNIWYGSTGFDINNESYYMVQTNDDCNVEITGTQANPTDHPITLSTGWNWIGYPCSTHQSFASAFAGLTPQDNDMVKSQSHGYASYMASYGIWYGTLSEYGIDPCMGLMYKSNNGSSFSFTYPQNKGDTPAGNDFIEGNHWTANYHAYPNNMTVTAVVELDDVEINSDNYELSAFANGECRGSVRLMHVAPLNRYMAFLTVAGDEASKLRFSLYDVETGTVETECLTSLQYETNTVIGNLETPYVVRFRSTTDLDEWANSLKIFPNPVAHGKNITLGLSTDEIGVVQIEIVNALGVVIRPRRTTSLQTLTAPDVAGVYTLRINVEGKGTCYRKLVVR